MTLLHCILYCTVHINCCIMYVAVHFYHSVWSFCAAFFLLLIYICIAVVPNYFEKDQRWSVRILLSSLTPPHSCACPKPWAAFDRCSVIRFLNFCWWNHWPFHCLNFLFILIKKINCLNSFLKLKDYQGIYIQMG